MWTTDAFSTGTQISIWLHHVASVFSLAHMKIDNTQSCKSLLDSNQIYWKSVFKKKKTIKKCFIFFM